jgi:hypothetical protein
MLEEQVMAEKKVAAAPKVPTIHDHTTSNLMRYEFE